jgi:F-type H+-transporting ATPase subunit c
MKRFNLAVVAPVVVAMLLVSNDAFAQDEYKGYVGLGAGLAIGLAAIGGALGQGMAARAALEGISRNPGASDKMNTPMILGLVLIESLVIYALVIAFFLQGKI